MNVVCVFKWARDPEDAWVGPDGSVTWRGAKFKPSDDDAAAIVFARELAQASGGDLVGVTIGNGDTSWAAARGAQRVVSIPDVGPNPDDAATAAALAAAVRCAGDVDVVVIGDALNHAGVAGTLGALLGIPVLVGIDDVVLDPADPGRVLASRRAGPDVETLAATPPLLLAVAAKSGEKDIPAVKDLLAARKRPITTVDAEQAGAPSQDTVAIVGSRAPETHTARIFGGATAAGDLVAELRKEGVL